MMKYYKITKYIIQTNVSISPVYSAANKNVETYITVHYVRSNVYFYNYTLKVVKIIQLGIFYKFIFSSLKGEKK